VEWSHLLKTLRKRSNESTHKVTSALVRFASAEVVMKGLTMIENTQWEYRIDVVGSAWRGTKPETIEEYLNELGIEGWEVINLHQPENSNKIWVTIKRPLTTATRRQRSRPEYQ